MERLPSNLDRGALNKTLHAIDCCYNLDMMKKRVKPMLGDLVRYDKRIYPKGWDQTALERVGLIIYTEGIRCTVRWCCSMKKSALIERFSLEVINASR